jgi:hypothetical protein
MPVEQANKAMRDALAFSARSENPVLISAITDIIAKIESLNFMDVMINDLEKQLDLMNKANDQPKE